MEWISGKSFLDISGLPELVRIKSGISSFDKICGGGLVKEGIHLMCGAPKAGKSLVVASLALEYAKTQKVVYVSCENGYTRDARRFNAMLEARHANQKDGLVAGFMDQNAYLDNLHYYDLSIYSGENGIALLKKILEKEEDGIVILDASERLVDIGSQDQIHNLGRQFIDELIIRKTQFCFIVSWQTIKNAAATKDKKLSSADLSGSCAMSQACDSFWFIDNNVLQCGRSRDGYDTDHKIEINYPLGLSEKSRMLG